MEYHHQKDMPAIYVFVMLDLSNLSCVFGWRIYMLAKAFARNVA